MEQAVWFYVGVISSLIGLGLLVSIVLMGTGASKEQLARNAAKTLAQQCNNVCNSDPGTMFGVETELSSGSVLRTSGKSICADYGAVKECQHCSCDVMGFDFKPFKLDLSTPEALQLFERHRYNCTFEKTMDASGGYVVVIRCKG